jgi:hypothetical protein
LATAKDSMEEISVSVIAGRASFADKMLHKIHSILTAGRSEHFMLSRWRSDPRSGRVAATVPFDPRVVPILARRTYL